MGEGKAPSGSPKGGKKPIWLPQWGRKLFLAVKWGDLKLKISKLEKNSNVMIDQIRAIGHKRLIKKIGDIPEKLRLKTS